jgi:hypothetical protein
MEDFPHAKVVSTIDQLLALGLDLLVVASANIVHAEQALAGIDAGVPVVVDKPMALSYEQTKRKYRSPSSSTAGGIVTRSRSRKLWKRNFWERSSEWTHGSSDSAHPLPLPLGARSIHQRKGVASFWIYSPI